MGTYRKAFFATAGVALILAAALALMGWRYFKALHGTAIAQPRSAAVSSAESQPAMAPSVHTALAAVQLTPQRLQTIGVKTGVVGEAPVSSEIRTTGNVDVDEQLLSYVQVRFQGYIQRVFGNYTYQYVRKGQPLFTIYSPDLVTTEREYLIAKRNQGLLAASTVPGVASGASSLLTAAAERLKQWEIPGHEIAHLKATGQVRNELEIDSPVSGYITERNALPNMFVQPGTGLYTIADLSTVWVYAEVFQNQISQIKIGDPAAVTVDSYPGRIFHGRVDYIWPQIDMATRTAKARMVFANPGIKLTPGMFVTVRMTIPLGTHLVIPASGVFQTGTRAMAFVDRGGGYLEPREVQLGTQAGGQYIVLKGLKAGEQIVTSANFLIDSESQLQAAIGAFMPPPPGAGIAAAMNAPAAQAAFEFTTSPSPPHKGSDIFHVKLTGRDGKPVEGARVTVTLFMPPMPAMGMSAMRTVVTLSDKGGGMYEGNGNLGSGGTWQVSIAVQKGGQTIAAKQLTLAAEGGM